MKKLLIYLKAYRKEACLAPIFKMLEAVFELFVPLVIKGIIDYGIAAEDRAYCLRMGLLLLLLAVIGLAMATTAQWFSARAAAGFAAKIKQVLMEHIQKLSYTELDTIGTSTLITRMTSDVNQVQTGTNLVLRLFMRSPFIVFGSMIMAFTIDFKAAMIFVITIPLLSVVVFGIMLSSIPLYKKVQSALDKVLGITRENLTGSRVIRAFNKEDDEKIISLFKDIIGDRVEKYLVESLKNEETPAMILVSEESRRMMEMQSRFAGMDFGMNLKEEKTLVINNNNLLVKKLVSLKDNEDKKEEINVICNQIVDLALLANKELNAEELDLFIKRSNSLMSKVISL